VKEKNPRMRLTEEGACMKRREPIKKKKKKKAPDRDAKTKPGREKGQLFAESAWPRKQEERNSWGKIGLIGKRKGNQR